MVGIRENRHRPPLSVSKDACGLPALMTAQCPILESSLMFYGVLRIAARGHPEIHGIGELRLSLRRSEALFRQTVRFSSLSSRANYAPCSQETGHQYVENPVCLLRTERNFRRPKFRPERTRSFGIPGQKR